MVAGGMVVNALGQSATPRLNDVEDTDWAFVNDALLLAEIDDPRLQIEKGLQGENHA